MVDKASPSRRQRRSAETRTRLLDAALAAFLANGYDNTSLAEITERADLGTGTLYLYFRDKRAIYEEVARHELAGMYEQWQKRGGTRVSVMVEVFLEFLTDKPELARLFLLDGPAVESWLVDDVARMIATFLDGPQPQLRANLMIGATLAAARHFARTEPAPSARTLIATAARFCEAGLAAEPRRKRTDHA
jgi:AcrR family transcriptional regulator